MVPVRSMQATSVRLLSARWVCHIATRSLNSLAQVGCMNIDTVSFHRFLFNLDVQESEVRFHAELPLSKKSPSSPFHQQFRQAECILETSLMELKCNFVAAQSKFV